MAEFYRKKKKVCQLCAGKELNYKDVENVRKYVDREKFKILHFEPDMQSCYHCHKPSWYVHPSFCKLCFAFWTHFTIFLTIREIFLTCLVRDFSCG